MNITENNTTHEFLQSLDAITETPLGKFAKSQGFSVWHSGGGCHHFRKENSDGFYVLVCHEFEIPKIDPGAWTIGLFDSEGIEVDIIDIEGKLEEALAASDKLLMESCQP